MPFTARLVRFTWKVLNAATGLPVPGVTVALRWQGATVSGLQSGGPGNFTVTVYSRGDLDLGNDTLTVAVNAGSAQHIVGTVTDTTVQLTGLGSLLTLQDNDRLTVVDSAVFPKMFRDITGAEEQVTSPVTDANGECGVWVRPGVYDVYESGGTITPKLTQDVSVGGERLVEIWITDSRFGAKFDGVTDDYDAYLSAIEYIRDEQLGGSGVQGGIIHGPRGISRVRLPIPLDYRIILRGQGRGTEIQPTAGFSWNGTTDALVQLGPVGGASNLFTTRVEDLSLNCLGQANSIGLYSDNANEGCGWSNILIRSAALKGVYLDGTGGGGSCRNMHCTGLEVGVTTASGIGFHLKSVTEQNTFDNVSISATGTTPTTSKGVYIEGSSARAIFHGLHVEYFDIGADFGATTKAIAHGVTGAGNVTTMLRFNDEEQGAFGIAPAGTNIIVDNSGKTGHTSTIASFDGSFYYIGAAHADGTSTVETDFYSTGAGAPTTRATQLKQIHHARQEIRNQVTWLRQTIASAAVIDATNFAQRGTFWTLTGSAAISTITTDSSDDSRILLLKNGAGHTASVVSGGNITLTAGNWVPTSSNEYLLLVSDGTTWRDVTRTTASPIAYTGRETIASASTVTLGASTWSVQLTGTTTVTKLASAATYAGRRVIIRASGGGDITITNGVAGTANDILILDNANHVLGFAGEGALLLESNGTNWTELARFNTA
jgi:hypothetical protein